MTSPNDIICTRLLLEEGAFLQRMANQHRDRPNESPGLSLTAFPFLALIEHDAVPYLETKCGIRLSHESKELKRTRHRTKSLNSRFLKYENYSEEARKVILASSQHFSKTGIARLFPTVKSNDVGISFFEGMPVYSTHIVSYKFGKTISPVDEDESEKQYFLEYGYGAGSAGSILVALADQHIQDKALFSARPFRLTANDFSYDELIKPLARKGVEDEVVFFFISEILTQIASVEALRRAGFLDDLLWIKLSTYCLFHAEKALGSFSGFVHKKEHASLYPDEFVHELSLIISREERKRIKSSRKLRDSFVHYDFKELTARLDSKNEGLWKLLDIVIYRAVDMNLQEYAHFLSATSAELISRLSRLIDFPPYDSQRNVLE